MNPNLDSLFFVALWAWMRAHPDCDFDEFNGAIRRIIDRLAKAGVRTEAQPS